MIISTSTPKSSSRPKISITLPRGLCVALGQSVIVESRTGASCTLAAAQVARAAPDGYTLMVIPSGHPTAAVTFAKLPFRPVADFAMITLASTYPYVMAVPSATGIKNARRG